MRWLRMMPLVLLVATACKGDEEEGAAPARTATGETPTVTAALLSPVRAVSIAEIEATEAAAQKTAREDLRRYAQTVAIDHRALVAILDSVAAATGTRLTVTPAAREIDSVVRTAHSSAQNMTGFDFDATFVRAEVEAQRQLIERIDQDLLPTAAKPETQTLLRDIRTMADAHMTRARQLLGALANAPDTEPADPTRPTTTTPGGTTTPRPRPATPPFVPTAIDSPRPPVTTGPPVIGVPIPITTSG
jgi:predicted outer membrane protein